MAYRRNNTYTDLELQSHYRAGHPHAFRRLVDRHFPALLSYLGNFTGRDRDAEDICLESLHRLGETILAGAAIENVGAWLRTTANRRFVDLLRSERSRGQELVRELREADSDAPLGDGYDSEPDRLWRVLIRQIPRLSDEQRSVIVQHYLYAQPPREIAARTGRPVAEIYNLLNGARKRLRRLCTNPSEK